MLVLLFKNSSNIVHSAEPSCFDINYGIYTNGVELLIYEN